MPVPTIIYRPPDMGGLCWDLRRHEFEAIHPVGSSVLWFSCVKCHKMTNLAGKDALEQRPTDSGGE